MARRARRGGAGEYRHKIQKRKRREGKADKGNEKSLDSTEEGMSEKKTTS